MKGNAAGALDNYRQALAGTERLVTRAPGSLYLQRDRGDVLEVMGRYFANRSVEPGIGDVRRTELKTEARAWFEKSLDIWRDWTERRIASPYAGRRERETVQAIAAVTQP
jgi:hypothetical protein